MRRENQAGGAQALPGEQVVGDRGPRDGVLVLEQQARVLESPLLAGGIHVHQDVAGGQDAHAAAGAGMDGLHHHRTARRQRIGKTAHPPLRIERLPARVARRRRIRGIAA